MLLPISVVNFYGMTYITELSALASVYDTQEYFWYFFFGKSDYAQARMHFFGNIIDCYTNRGLMTEDLRNRLTINLSALEKRLRQGLEQPSEIVWQQFLQIYKQLAIFHQLTLSYPNYQIVPDFPVPEKATIADIVVNPLSNISVFCDVKSPIRERGNNVFTGLSVEEAMIKAQLKKGKKQLGKNTINLVIMDGEARIPFTPSIVREILYHSPMIQLEVNTKKGAVSNTTLHLSSYNKLFRPNSLTSISALGISDWHFDEFEKVYSYKLDIYHNPYAKIALPEDIFLHSKHYTK